MGVAESVGVELLVAELLGVLLADTPMVMLAVPVPVPVRVLEGVSVTRAEPEPEGEGPSHDDEPGAEVDCTTPLLPPPTAT